MVRRQVTGARHGRRRPLYKHKTLFRFAKLASLLFFTGRPTQTCVHRVFVSPHERDHAEKVAADASTTMRFWLCCSSVLAHLLGVAGQDDIDTTPYNDAQMGTFCKARHGDRGGGDRLSDDRMHYTLCTHADRVTVPCV